MATVPPYIQRDLDAAIRDEDEAIRYYQILANSIQTWLNTLPSEQRYLLQGMVNDIRFIQADEIRHRTTLQGIKGRL